MSPVGFAKRPFSGAAIRKHQQTADDAKFFRKWVSGMPAIAALAAQWLWKNTVTAVV